MLEVIFIIVIVGYIIYRFTKNYNRAVQTGVTNQGGMLNKYSLLIEYLTAHPASRITKVTKDSVTVTSSTMTFWLDYVGGNTEVSLKGNLPLLGNISKRWNFPGGYPQEKMIEEIENYLNWQVGNMGKISENDYGQYLKY